MRVHSNKEGCAYSYLLMSVLHQTVVTKVVTHLFINSFCTFTPLLQFICKPYRHIDTLKHKFGVPISIYISTDKVIYIFILYIDIDTYMNIEGYRYR